MRFRRFDDEPRPDPTVPDASADEIEFVKMLHDAGAVTLAVHDLDGHVRPEGWCGVGDNPPGIAYIDGLD